MSRIGKRTIQIPAGVTLDLTPTEIKVTGPKGTLARQRNAEITIKVDGSAVTLAVAHEEEKRERSLWGTWGAHIQNMIDGVVTGFSKQLEVNGVGYRVAMQGKDLKLEVGYSHPVIFAVPVGITATVEKNVITLKGIDKEMIGQIASEIRAVRKPEPYKGKGIKYMDETIRRKAGKAAKSAA